MKTFVFCTAFGNTEDRWQGIFGRWINALENSNLEYDQLLMIDDGSSFLPNWEGVEIITENNLPDQVPESRGVIYHFDKNMGYFGHADYPGWYRSFMFAATYAEKYNFEKIIHIESDAFLLTDRIRNYVNDLKEGWTTFWCPRHQFPENNIQIIAGNSVKDFIAWNNKKIPYSEYKGTCAEFWTPYTFVNKDFKGDRWGEFAPGMAAVPDPNCPPGVPYDADFVCQVRAESPCWWLE